MTVLKLFCKIPVWVSSLVVVALIAYLTLVPKPFGDEDIPLFPGADKVVHFLMFGGLAWVLTLDWWRHRRMHLGMRSVIVWAVVSSLAGGVVELAQAGMNLGRSGDWYDLLADSLGAFACAFTAYLMIQHSSQS